MEAEKNGKVENVRVYVRVRPLNENEIQGKIKGTIAIDKENNGIRINNNEYRGFEKLFRFHQVFSEESSQLQIYHTVAAPIVETVLKGYNGTIFAYGQTGSGKTYTMVGDHCSTELQGIIPNSFSHIFNQISRSNEYTSFIVTATFLEIYNEEIKDLLSPRLDKKLIVHDDKLHGSFVRDLSGFTVNSIEELKKLFVRGNKNRTTKSNFINNSSSRSHAIFTILVESKNRNTNETLCGKLNFVDLAGSERLSRTKATGEMLREASHINLSLSVLGNVISNLVDGKSSHVPYRNSKLTRLLQDSLGGNSRTAMIATLSLAEIDYDESICTLRYAVRVRHIKNYVSTNRKTDGMIASFEKQIQELQAKVRKIHEEQILKQKKQYNLKIKVNEKKKIQEELIETENVKQDILTKINEIQQKIIVGGVNLLHRVEEQKILLDESRNQINDLSENNQMLEETLNKKNMAKIELKKNYTTLQEENEDLDRKIDEVQKELQEAKEEQKRQQSEQQFEMEKKLEYNKSFLEDISLYNIVIDNFIPKVYRKKIESNIKYNDSDGEYRLNNVHQAGNHILKTNVKKARIDVKVPRSIETDFKHYKHE